MATKYRAEYYESNASKRGPYAVTKNESRWKGGRAVEYDEALAKAKEWAAGGGVYKTTRVVELNGDGEPVSVHWMSVWEKPDDLQSESIAFVPAAAAGKSVKLHVWMPTADGPPDHWLHFWQWMNTICGNANNWDLVYGREVDSRNRKTLWSIRINLWGADNLEGISEWAWWNIFAKTPEEADDVEFIRATDIGPREIPSGVETATCTNCEKIYDASRGWLGGEDEEPFCSCLCIDIYMGNEAYRTDPDGEETEDPGCVILAHATV